MATDFGGAALKMVGSLILVLGLILLFSYWLKRLRTGGLWSSRNMPSLRLLGTLSLAPKRALALVEVCGHWYVLGLGTENVTLISEIEPSQDLMNGPGGGITPQKGEGFQAVLRNAGLLRGKETETGGK
ncbi:MAG: flagellar biosynthetic protein FliO [Deltaproteobacteria bacterium]|nr:flagellar biosynthetic protein FliO [Deltaproteobacteria bacterium]